MEAQSDATTAGPRANGSGHRRVSSLVREFDAQATTTTTTDSMVSPSSGEAIDLVGGSGTAQLGGGGSALGVEYGGQADGQDEDGDVFVPLTGHESGYTTAPASPAKPTAQERHARRHSRLHSRNLSVFFPRPGVAVSGSLAGYEAPSGPSTSTVPSAALNATSYGNEAVSPPVHAVSADGAPPAHLTGRRGHHHRHSLSHNFFGFLEPPDGRFADDSRAASPSSVPRAVPLEPIRNVTSALPVNPSQSLRTRYSHLPTFLRILVAIAFHTPRATQLKLLVAVATVVLGATLWVYGQAGESLATTGLGYLVVFDGIGALSRIWVEGRAAGIEKVWDAAGTTKRDSNALRTPFGLRRQITLAHFSQCVFLLFSAVYVCKESVEHVLLLHGPGEDGGADGAGAHGSAHGSMGHGEALALPDEGGHAEIGIPTGALLICFALSLFSALGSGNHAGLAQAAGPSSLTGFRPSSGTRPSPANALLTALANPFVLITLLFSGGVAVSSLTLTSEQMGPLDKVLALLESVAMFYIGYPASVATGTVLLQTAPPAQTEQMASLHRGLRLIREHPKVALVLAPRVWQVAAQVRLAEDATDYRLANRDAQASVVVANVTVHLRPDAVDGDVLEVTRFAREKCAPAMRWASRLDSGKTSIEAGSGGELTVSVLRGLPS